MDTKFNGYYHPKEREEKSNIKIEEAEDIYYDDISYAAELC